MVIQYKCPDCGQEMTFDPASGTLKCPGCGHSEAINTSAHNGEMNIDNHGTYETQMDDGSTMQRYICQSCGAVLVTDTNTTATKCSYCGAAVVLGDKLEGTCKPDYCIPFKIDKRQANEAFKAWSKKLFFAPSDFKDCVKVKGVEGIYAPFWTFNMNGKGDARFDCTKEESHYEGNEKVTEIKHYDVYRKVDTYYDFVPADGSKRLDDKLMDLMEPFDYTNLKPFSAPYLTGYVAENYDFKSDEVYPRAKGRMDAYMTEYIGKTITGYNSRKNLSHHYVVTNLKTSYCLFPLWMNYVVYKGKDYSFAMNGETGKIAGKPPISKRKVWSFITGSTVVVWGLLRLISVLRGGPFLW